MTGAGLLELALLVGLALVARRKGASAAPGLAVAAGLLVLFHAWLLGHQLWDGELAEPGLFLRWLVGAALLAALAHLHRRGASLFWGRQAAATWLLGQRLAPAVTRAARAAF